MTVPYVPSPQAYATGQVPLSARLRADVAGTVALLTAPPLFIGLQTITSQVLATSGADYQVTLDTEDADTTGGHRINANEATWYAIVPGWYLAEGFAPLGYTGSTGVLAAGIEAQQSGVTVKHYGMIIPNASGHQSGCSVAKLCHMVSAGTYGSSSNDWVSLLAMQTAGSNVALYNGTVRQPRLMLCWAGALSGTAPLPAPPLQPWPVPPAYVTSSFMNANVTNAIAFLLYPPLMEYALLSGTQSLASQGSVPAQGATVKLTDPTVDNYSAYSAASGTWTAPASGRYYCYGQAAITTLSGTVALGAGLTVTSPNYHGGTAITMWGGCVAASGATGQQVIANVRRVLRLSAGDTVDLAAFQNDSGGHSATLEGPGEASCRLIILWRGA